MAKTKKVTDHKQQVEKLTTELESMKEVLNFKENISTELLTDLTAFTLPENKSLKEECSIITQLGDIHVEEEVKESIVNGLNKYNPEIAAQRVGRFFSRNIYLAQKEKRGGTKIQNLVLHLVGDGISGWIHEELKQTNLLTPVQACLLLEELYIKGLKTLSESGLYKKIIVVCSCGNHSRMTEKNQHKNSVTTSFEYWVYIHVKQYMELMGYSNIEFIISDSPFTYYNTYNKTNLFLHGNAFRYMGGVGGIYIPLNKFLLRENKVMKHHGGIDMAWMGHWHQEISIPGARVNGSVIGYSEYSRALGFEPEPPMQQWQLIDKRRGYTTNIPIYLQDF